MKNEERKKNLKEKYIELQLLEQHIQEVQYQLQLLNKKSQELKNLNVYLTELHQQDDKKEILSQVSSGIFVKAILKDTKNVIVGIGAGVAIESTIPNAKNIVEDQIKKISESVVIIEENLRKVGEQLQQTQEEVLILQKDN